MSGWWVLVDLGLLACLAAVLFFAVAVGVCVVAAETANQVYASGASAAAPGAGSEVNGGVGAPPVPPSPWAAETGVPQPPSRGGPTPVKPRTPGAAYQQTAEGSEREEA